MAKHNPYFSVVIPVYNLAHKFNATLDSLVEQTYKDFEVVIVDDFSKDYEELMVVVNAYREKLHINLIRHASNRNGAAARNTGLEASKGQYIAFLDADDTWTLDKLEVMKKVIAQESSSNNTVYYCKTNIVRGEAVVSQLPAYGINEDEPTADYLFCKLGFIQTSTIVCSRTLALSTKFDERFNRHQDWDFCIRAYALGFKFRFVDAVLSNYFVAADADHHKKIASRGFNPEYCLYWINEMRDYISDAAAAGYKFYVLAPAYGNSGRTMKALFTRFIAITKFNGFMRKRLISRAFLKITGTNKHS